MPCQKASSTADGRAWGACRTPGSASDCWRGLHGTAGHRRWKGPGCLGTQREYSMTCCSKKKSISPDLEHNHGTCTLSLLEKWPRSPPPPTSEHELNFKGRLDLHDCPSTLQRWLRGFSVPVTGKQCRNVEDPLSLAVRFELLLLLLSIPRLEV